MRENEKEQERRSGWEGLARESNRSTTRGASRCIGRTCIVAIDFTPFRFFSLPLSFFPVHVHVLVVVLLHLLFLLLLLDPSYTTPSSFKGKVRNTHILLLQKGGLVSRYGGGHALLPYINK